jgi:hypothetical protein
VGYTWVSLKRWWNKCPIQLNHGVSCSLLDTSYDRFSSVEHTFVTSHFCGSGVQAHLCWVLFSRSHSNTAVTAQVRAAVSSEGWAGEEATSQLTGLLTEFSSMWAVRLRDSWLLVVSWRLSLVPATWASPMGHSWHGYWLRESQQG